MKFGLAGYVSAHFVNGGMEHSENPTLILFGQLKGHQSLTIPVEQRDIKFVRN